MSLEEHSWQLILKVARELENADKSAITWGEPLQMKVFGLTYCPACDCVIDCESDIMGDFREVALIFLEVVFQSLAKAGKCNVCGRSAIPAGYIVSFKAQMLTGVDESKRDKFEIYTRALGTLKGHPKMQEG